MHIIFGMTIFKSYLCVMFVDEIFTHHWRESLLGPPVVHYIIIKGFIQQNT